MQALRLPAVLARLIIAADGDLVELQRFKVEDDMYHADGEFPAFDVAMYTDKIQKRDTGK